MVCFEAELLIGKLYLRELSEWFRVALTSKGSVFGRGVQTEEIGEEWGLREID